MDKPIVKSSTTPVCTICIANYNGELLLADCIDSVLNQDCTFSFDIIVHDDASTDKSLELLATQYPEVKVITSQSNVGFCISNNRMVKEATGQFILLLNNDAALAPDALKTLHEHATQQPIQGILTLPQYDWESGNLVDRGCLLDPFYNPVPNKDPSRRDVAMVIGACLWIPRSLWNELGGFPEWFESIAEDMQICCHARLLGFPVEVPENSGYRHRQGKSFGGNRSHEGKLQTSFRRRRLSEQNKTFVLTLCTPLPDLIYLLPLHLLALLAEGTILSLIKMDYRILTDIYANTPVSLVKNIKTIRTTRKSIQRSKTITAKTYRKTFNITPRKITMLIDFGLPRIH